MRNNFLPQSRYYGDRYARTMEEAFGPGAQLDPDYEEDDPLVCMILGAVIFAGFLGLVVTLAFWAVRAV